MSQVPKKTCTKAIHHRFNTLDGRIKKIHEILTPLGSGIITCVHFLLRVS